MSKSAEDILRQNKTLESFRREGSEAWTAVYQSWDENDRNGARFSCFAPKRKRRSVLSDTSWDLGIGSGSPGFTEYWNGDTKTTKYLRFGGDSGIEPLVITQDHYGMRPEMVPQLAEEFRLYHNLWVNQGGTKLYKINMDGTEELAAEVNADEVRVRTKYLRQFQAGRQLDLVLFIDSVQYANDPGGAVDLEALADEIETKTERLSLYAADHVHGKKRPFSRLLGKRVLPPPERAKAGIWPFDEKPELHHDFIIGENSDGEPIRFTSDPDKLANYFGKNPDAPHYLTPVYFRRDVLQRYYESPERFSVEDGYLRCGGLWGLRLDNDHPKHVMVFLGDLGRDLPESERPYWQSFNVAPSGGMSATVFKRSFEGEFADPEAPDLRFKYRYGRFKSKWTAKVGWALFKDLEPADKHVYQRLRIPLNDSQPEFEDQVAGLTKILVDSLDEKNIAAQLSTKVKDEKGIAKLERWMHQDGYPWADRDIGFLRRLQRLRSKLAAHRKGSDYEQVLVDEQVDDDTIREVVLMFHSAVRMLHDLAAHQGIDLEEI